jgi:rRNA maturation endonuclease Nob1
MNLKDLHNRGWTKYIIVLKCCNCEKINENSLKTCSHCGHNFLGEVSETEKKEYEEQTKQRALLLE